jgi:hypothetical protein
MTETPSESSRYEQDKSSTLADFRAVADSDSGDEQYETPESFAKQLRGEALTRNDSQALRNKGGPYVSETHPIGVVHVAELFGETAAEEKARLALEQDEVDD